MPRKASTKDTPNAARLPHRAQAPAQLIARSPAADAAQIQRALSEPASASPKAILALQRASGNRAVQNLLSHRTVQAKLTVGPARDHFEQEADRVASAVMRISQPAAASPHAPARGPQAPAVRVGQSVSSSQRQTQTPEDALQTKRADSGAGFEAGAGFENQLQAAQGGGTPLTPPARSFMEARFGADFGRVRVHTGSDSAQLNRAVSAQAFTHGSDIYFAPGKYDPASSDGKTLLAHELTHVVQQTGAQSPSAQRDLLQRDPISAGAVAKPGWTLSRPNVVQTIDTQLALLASKLATLPGAVDQIKALITQVLQAINGYNSSKEKGGKWDKNVLELETAVKSKEIEIDAKITDREQGKVKFEEFKTLEPSMAQYATRSMLGASQFQPTALATINTPSVRTALTRPRGPNDALTPQAVSEMTATQAGEIDQEKSTAGRDVTLGGMTVEEVRTFMAAHTNTLTKQTMYPELRNLTDPSPNPDNVTTTPVLISGVTMQVEHNESDVNYTDRLKLVQDAVAKISASGITVPALNIHMPKYGRGLKLKAGVGSGGATCEDSSKSSRAVFIPPGFMHLSSEMIGTPDVTKVTNPVTKAEEYKFSSTGFDPSGAATIVHEFGHALHYASSPGKFQGLWGTTFKGPSENIAVSQVSQYGSKPREFVAEVFLGLMYGKAYSDEVLKMYKAFGGIIPPGLAVKFATL